MPERCAAGAGAPGWSAGAEMPKINFRHFWETPPRKFHGGEFIHESRVETWCRSCRRCGGRKLCGAERQGAE